MDYDVGVVKQRRIISPNSLYFISSGAAAKPSYSFLNVIDTTQAGATFTYQITVPEGSSRIVVVNSLQSGFNIVSVTVNSVTLTQDVRAVSGGNETNIYSLSTATIGGPGTYNVEVTLSAGFGGLFSRCYSLANVSASAVPVTASNPNASAPAPFDTSITATIDNIMFATGMETHFGDTVVFDASTTSPIGGTHNSTALTASYGIAEWVLTVNGAYNIDWQTWAGNQVVCVCAAIYGP